MKQKLTIQGREVIIEGRVLNEPLRRDSFAYDKPKKFPPYRIYWADTKERVGLGEWKTQKEAKYWIAERNWFESKNNIQMLLNDEIYKTNDIISFEVYDNYHNKLTLVKNVKITYIHSPKVDMDNKCYYLFNTQSMKGKIQYWSSKDIRNVTKGE